MPCPDQENLIAFADGELDASKAVHIEGHLGSCAACRQVVAEFRNLNALGKSAILSINVPAAFSPKVIPLPPPVSRLRPLALAAAAIIVTGLLTAFWLTHRTPRATGNPVAISSPSTAPKITAQSALPSDNDSFERWAENYRRQRVPLVTAEEAGSYNPPAIRPFGIDATIY
jgi:anti-sigma factor RsiW